MKKNIWKIESTIPTPDEIDIKFSRCYIDYRLKKFSRQIQDKYWKKYIDLVNEINDLEKNGVWYE